ncbi:MAG: diguanylate cyclase [Candidatus Wallbacteria bacterium]|nr:diguanylate cyclase [Candidatus Wallbacteria bacterium]
MTEKAIRIPLRTKLLITFVGIAVIPLIFLGYGAVMEIKSAITDNVLEQNLEIANIVAQELNQIVKNAQNIIETAIRNPSVKKMEFETAKHSLKSLVENFEIFDELYLISTDYDGLSIKKKEGYVLTTEKKEEMEEITQIWQMIFYFGESHGYISPVFFTRWGKTYPYLYMGFQIRNELYQLVGVIIAKLNLTEIWPIVNRIQIGHTGFAFVIDDNFRLMAHSNSQEVICRPMQTHPAARMVFNSQSGGGRNEFKDSERAKYFLSAYAKLKDYYSSKELKQYLRINWGVIVEQESDEAYQKVYIMFHQAVYMLLISFLIAIFISMYLAHNFTASLKKLVIGAQNIARGDLATSLTVSSNDEIGELTEQFDKMRIDLRKKIDEMEILIEVSKDISSVLDYRQLLKKILDKNIQVLDADTGSIMLFDDTSSELTIEASYGLPPDVVRNTRVSPGEGIVGWVFRIRKELIIFDTKKEPGFAELKGRSVEEGCLMSAPLIAKDKILGVVNVRKKVAYSFDKKDLDLFRALSIHAAIAIDNAKLYRQAVTDGLTKLYNHQYFQQKMDSEIERSRYSNKPFSMMITDIDHFKSFNDTYGHQVGDRVLRTVSRLLESSVREFDMVARYGGEEFAVICPGIGKDEAMIPAERIRKSVEEYEFMVDGKKVPITISIGVSEYGKDATEKKNLIECADRSLYYAKENGRNRVIKFSTEIIKNE